jgi:hypothetical protein
MRSSILESLNLAGPTTKLGQREPVAEAPPALTPGS